nr:hypothetical protein [Tanacetum cinerariifolium]
MSELNKEEERRTGTGIEQQNTVSLDKANEITCNANEANHNVVNKCKHGPSSEVKTNCHKLNNSYAKVVGNGSVLSKELLYIPTGVNENGDALVIFEEELVKEGSMKWQLTEKGGINEEIKNKENSRENDVRMNESLPSLEKNDETVNEVRKSANKFAVLGNYEENKNNHEDVCFDDRVIVDWFVLKKQKPDEETTKKWTYDMKQYFKYTREALNRGDGDSDEENDVLEMKDDTIDGLIAEEINGNDSQLLN